MHIRSYGILLLVALVGCGDDDSTSEISSSSGAGGVVQGGSGGSLQGGAGGVAQGGSGGSLQGGVGGVVQGGSGGSLQGGVGGVVQGGSGGSLQGGAGGVVQGGNSGTGTCASAPDGGSTTVQKPVLKLVLKDRWEEAWLGSAAVADLDGDGKNEIIVPRADKLMIWSLSGEVKAKVQAGSRIWSSPIVADLRKDLPGLEVAFASGDKVFVVDASGKTLPGFPVTWEKELRSLAAGDLDGDGKLELIVAPAHGGPKDVMQAWHADGSKVAGFPPNASGVSGCSDGKCYLAGCFDQNVAIGDLDGDGKADVVVGQDNAYASFHHGSGVAFDANPMFKPKKTPGVRYLHDLALAKQGYANDENTALQAHFTNTAPALADIDGDGKLDILMLASVQNASQSDREKGVALWAVHPDASRLDAWQEPFHAPGFLAGLWDYDDTNIVGATNQVSVADLDANPGLEMVFAGFDGKIHAVSAQRKELWSYTYTTDKQVLTGGVAIGDLSGDGRPEIVFASYSTENGKGSLFILSASGQELHKIALPRRGAMPVPTLADVDGDGVLDIVVSLKDAEDKVESVQVYSVPGSSTHCLPWPTGRGNYLRDGRGLL